MLPQLAVSAVRYGRTLDCHDLVCRWLISPGAVVQINVLVPGDKRIIRWELTNEDMFSAALPMFLPPVVLDCGNSLLLSDCQARTQQIRVGKHTRVYARTHGRNQHPS